MDISLYNYSLCIALSLMLFFGIDMIFARVPDKNTFANYLLSRRLMGVALLVLSVNYAAHFLFGFRLKALNVTILVNMVTYFLCYWLFSSALMTLLVDNYVTKRRLVIHIAIWLAYLSLALCELMLAPSIRPSATIFLAVLLVLYGLYLSVRLLRTYRKSIRLFENTHSDAIGAYIRWLSVFTYWATGFGVSCALLTFIPDRYVFLWILAAIPFYIYLFCCYQNYMLFHEKVETAFQEDAGMKETQEDIALAKETPDYFPDIEQRMAEWIEKEGYRKPGLTLFDLSHQLCTNRTYLSEYINTVYHQSFREWISGLRIEFAKRLMKQCPQLKMLDISEKSGFLSLSHFSRTFSEKEGCSPARWRKE